MTVRALLIGVAVVALALAALALALAVRAARLRLRAGKRPLWGGLVFRVALIAGLVAAGVTSLAHLPPPDMTNRPAPVTADAVVAYVQGTRDGSSQVVVGVSARDGATLWTRTLGAPVTSLLTPYPAILVAVTVGDGLYALRVTDGAVFWHSTVVKFTPPGMVMTDGARIYALTPAVSSQGATSADMVALDLLTGALAWRVSLPMSVTSAAVGDGLVFVAGDAIDPRAAITKLALVALGAADGAQRWIKTEVVNNVPNVLIRAALITGGYAIIVPQIGPVTALRERDGATAWTATPDPQEPDNPPQNDAATADGGTLYITTQPSRWAPGPNGSPIQPPVSLVAMRMGGTVRWRVTIPPGDPVGSSLVLSDGVLISGMSVDLSRGWAGYNPTRSLLTAYDAASGRALWRDNTPRVGISWDMSPAINPWGGSGVLFLMGIQADPYIQDLFKCVIFCPGVSWVYAVNVRTGAPWWRVRMGYVTLSHLVF